jgi:hypothetical protein
VGYSYNGTVLPGLPEWDKVAYPYAVIGVSNDGVTYFIYKGAKYTVSDSGTFYVPASGASCYSLNNNVWIANYLTMKTITPIWANYDLCKADESVYMSASEPIPVYE